MKKKNRLSGILTFAAWAVLGMHVFNKSVFTFATAGQRLTRGRQSYFSWKFGNIYYSKCGKGSPVLLIHDLSSEGCDYEWNGVRSELAKRHTVYTIDLPGCGRSEKEKMVYTNYLYVAAVSDFVRKIIGMKTDVVTSGRSSSIAVMACRLDSSIFGRLVLINPEHFYENDKRNLFKDRILCDIMMLPLIGNTFYTISTLRGVIASKLRTESYVDPFKVNIDDINCFYEAAHLGGSSARFVKASMIGHYTDVNVVDALKKLDSPVRIISGAGVPGSRYNMEKYINLCIDAKGCLVHGSGMPHMEYPSETTRRIEKYLRE